MAWSSQDFDYLLVGNPSGVHMEVGNCPDGFKGMRLYTPDGVTQVVNFDAAAGVAAIVGTLVLSAASSVPGSTVTGAVANATHATNADTVPASGIASGPISGLLVVGNTAGPHAEIGTHPHDGSPSQDFSGIRLYASDGTTVVVNLDVLTGNSTVTGKQQTGISGSRIIQDPAGGGIGNPQSIYYTGNTVANPSRLNASAGVVGDILSLASAVMAVGRNNASLT